MPVFYVILALLAALTVGVCGFILWGVNFSCKRGKPSVYKLTGEFADRMKEGIDWTNAKEKESVSIKSHDGLNLSGVYIDNDKTDILFILFHGYRSGAVHDFSGAVRFYYDRGYSILLVDQRSHGMSEGKYITYGARERFDCRDWCRYAKERFPEKKVFIDGISMGASTVLMASGLDLPDNVVGVIADCGYTSPYEIISKVAAEMGYPVKIVMPVLSSAIKLIAGFDPKGCSTLDAMEKNTLPVLLVHGKADSFVPYEMSVRTYDACRAPKTLLIVDNADHGVSFFVDNEKVVKVLSDFINDSLSRKERV